MPWSKIVSLSIPSLVAIFAVEVLNVLMYAFGPVSNNLVMLIVWLVIQSISGFVFGYISDQRIRKLILVISQILGVIGGLILYIFHLEIWVMIFIGLLFNPLPVARAAMLDNFSKVPSLRIIGVTFIAQYMPWFLFKYIVQIQFQQTILWILIILSVNIFLTIFLFRDNYDKVHNEEKKSFRESKLFYVLAAFILAEMAFYLEWDFLEYRPLIRFTLTTSTFATILGIIIAMLYSRLPHFSIITLCYFLAAAVMFTALFHCSYSNYTWTDIQVSGMTNLTAIGGLYLPFVADAIINILGAKHRAFSSALIEFCGVIASFGAAMINLIFKMNSIVMIALLASFFLIAAILQKKAEKIKKVSC